MKVLKITTDNAVEVVENDEKFVGYRTLSDGVGGMIEIVTLSDELTMWVNEEGKMDGLPYNNIASRLFDKVFGVFVDEIVGDVIISGGTDDDGETLGLTDDQIEKLTTVLDPYRPEWSGASL
jgi:hypothetical protein